MNTEKRTSRINADTKLAWQQNWEEIDIDTILTIFDYPRVKEMLKAYKGFLKREDRIIEAGCGLGPWVIELTRQGYDITGNSQDKVI
jgi:tRNA G46 methylase TrmB